MILHRLRRQPAAVLLLTSLFFVGCASATNQMMSQADLEAQRGNLDTAIAHYQQVLLDDPGNTS